MRLRIAFNGNRGQWVVGGFDRQAGEAHPVFILSKCDRLPGLDQLCRRYFDPQTGDIVEAPIPQQTEIVLEQMRLCLETAGSSLDHVLKCNVYCTSVEHFAEINEIYGRYFTTAPPARIFVAVPAWPGRFDIEIDCIATV